MGLRLGGGRWGRGRGDEGFLGGGGGGGVGGEGLRVGGAVICWV